MVATRRFIDDTLTEDELLWWPPDTRQLIREHYRFLAIVDGLVIYVPATDGRPAPGR